MEGRPLEEAELIERARGGDVEAYEVLVQSHQMMAFRTALLITGDRGEAEDAAQSGFLKAYGALGRFDVRRPFRPWLLTIVANEARNRRRSAGRRTKLELRLAEGHPRDDAAPSPEGAVLERERARALVEALNSLRVEDRLALAYRYLLGFDEVETAAALGCARGTVKSRLSRAAARLRETLDPDSFRSTS